MSTQSTLINGGTPSSNSGELLTLVSGYQSRNNHRAVISGSMAMCSDEFLAVFGPSNRRFCEEMFDWVMQESGVLRVNEIRHHKEGSELDRDSANPENYFIEDRIEYFVTIDQKTKGAWSPLVKDDLQLEFVMLEPYIRQALPHQANGTYSTVFRTP